MNASQLVPVASQLGPFYAALPDAVEAPALAPPLAPLLREARQAVPG
jgi:hypothetical protein